jgi:hypothetical protein
MLYNGRHPSIKDGVGFETRGKGNTKINVQGKKFLQFVKDKAPIVHDDDAYIIYSKNYHAHVKNAKVTHVHHSNASSSKAFRYRHIDSHGKFARLPKNKVKNAPTGSHLSFHTFDVSYVLTNKSGKVVAKYVRSRHNHLFTPSRRLSIILTHMPLQAMLCLIFPRLVWISGGTI